MTENVEKDEETLRKIIDNKVKFANICVVNYVPVQIYLQNIYTNQKPNPNFSITFYVKNSF